MAEFEIEIDGKPCQAHSNQMVIQVADAEGIYIPRFCYHKHLSIAANCRMCLVEVEKSAKPLPACATPVTPGMKVFTRSSVALSAQKSVMEFLLINHPLDCPVCDQGGECELQDLSLGYGATSSRYLEGKRSVKDEDLGPLVETEMTRCIHCTRCVRFGAEIAGVRELGGTHRGEHLEIGTYVEHALRSEVSGNIIDLCPVGALTSKPFRFSARAWELTQLPSVAVHDGLGSNIYVHIRNGQVMRVVPRENAMINETWLSDRDRFSYEALTHPDRLTHPRILVQGQWQETDWETALQFIAAECERIKKTYGAEAIGALASPQSTLEEFYLLQKVMRQLGSPHVDHRLRQIDFSLDSAEPLSPQSDLSLAEIESSDVILIIGSNLPKEQPLLTLRVRKAAVKGAAVFSLNMMDFVFPFDVVAKKIVTPNVMVSEMRALLEAVDKRDAEHPIAAQLLLSNKKIVILLGTMALHHPEAALLKALARQLAEKCQGKITLLTDGANATGAWLAGMIPHRGPFGQTVTPGFNTQQQFAKPRKGYLLWNIEPDKDCANAYQAMKALSDAECVVAVSLFSSPFLEKTANVILPLAAWTETEGTWVNFAGEWQTVNAVAAQWAESRPGWKIIRALGKLLQLEGFDYENCAAILSEIQQLQQHSLFSPIAADLSQTTQYPWPANKYYRIGEVPAYSLDPILRRASALQATQAKLDKALHCVQMNSTTASQLKIKEHAVVTLEQEGIAITVTVVFNESVPDQAVWIRDHYLLPVLPTLLGPIDITRKE